MEAAKPSAAKPAEDIADLANRALENLGGAKASGSSIQDVAKDALKKIDKGSDKASSCSSGDTIPDLARRALNNLP